MAASRLALVSPHITAHSASHLSLRAAGSIHRRCRVSLASALLPARTLTHRLPSSSICPPAISPALTSPGAASRLVTKRTARGDRGAARASASDSAATEGSMTGSTRRVVEHLVYFQVKPDTPPSAIAAMVNGLRALASAPGVLFLAVGTALPLPPPLPASPWTHALLGRYESRDALQAYAASEAHVRVVEGCIKPIISDIVAVDWEVEVEGEVGGDRSGDSADTAVGACTPPRASVIHSVMMELTPSATPEALTAMLAGLRAHAAGGAAHPIPGLEFVSVGENFAPARAKGFTWGFASFHRDEAALRGYGGDERHQRVMQESVLPITARFASVDFRVDEEFGGSKL